MIADSWGIPILDVARQAAGLAAPVVKWGTARRGGAAGTIHFYTDDYKFTRLWLDPSKVSGITCSVAVEVNFSTHANMSRAEALWAIFRKRTLARAWQAGGIRTVVDLNVEPKFRDLALLGVPAGWNAYATRVHRGVPFAVVEDDFAQAAAHAGRPDPFFVVFGGGQKVQVACRDRGWPWVPEHRKVVEGRWAAYGTGIVGGVVPGQGGAGVEG